MQDTVLIMYKSILLNPVKKMVAFFIRYRYLKAVSRIRISFVNLIWEPPTKTQLATAWYHQLSLCVPGRSGGCKFLKNEYSYKMPNECITTK